MELVNAYMRKVRDWDEKRVNHLPGAYAAALKKMYGYRYVHVDVKANKRRMFARRAKGVVQYKSEII